MTVVRLDPHDDGVVLWVRAAPGSRREGIVGTRGDALKVAVTAPPERGRANNRLLAVLAKELGMSRRDLSLIAGETSRDKRVLVRGVSTVELHRSLEQILAP